MAPQRQQQRQQQQHYMEAWWHGKYSRETLTRDQVPLPWLQLYNTHSSLDECPMYRKFYYAKRKSERKILSRIRGRSGLSLSSQERTQGRALPPSESSSGASSDDDMSDNGAASSDETRDGGADGVKVNDAHSDCGHRQGNGLWDFSSEIYGRLNSIKRQKNQDRENYKWLVALAKCSRIFTRGRGSKLRHQLNYAIKRIPPSKAFSHVRKVLSRIEKTWLTRSASDNKQKILDVVWKMGGRRQSAPSETTLQKANRLILELQAQGNGPRKVNEITYELYR